MARTLSTMVKLGSAAPAFQLPDVVTGKAVSLADFPQARGLLVMFICQHCPYVKHVEQELARIGKDYADSGLAIVAISSNDAAACPDDAPESLAEQARRLGFAFPYLYDETQEVARAYDAACTPDLFLFDQRQKLAYRGQLDDSRPRRGDSGNDIPVTGKDLRAAIDAVLAGQPVPAEQRPSLGCNIKWKESAH
jgi:peroxiredoxin